MIYKNISILNALSLYLSPLTRWLSRLESRERRAVSILALVVFALLLWKGIWQPIEAGREKAEDDYKDARNSLAWMMTHAKDVHVESRADSKKDDRPLLMIATNAAQPYHLVFSHAEPGENDTLRLSLENAVFSHLIEWLDSLKRNNGVIISQLSVEKQDASGIVNANITLESP